MGIVTSDVFHADEPSGPDAAAIRLFVDFFWATKFTFTDFRSIFIQKKNKQNH